VRRSLQMLCAVLLAVALLAHAAGGDEYPARAIRLVVPYPPGAGTDGTARIVADALSQRLGQTVFIDNRPGASGTIGTDLVAKAAADGYTLLWTSTDSMTAVPALWAKVPYKVPDDFTYIAKVADTGMAVVVAAKLPVHNLAEFIDYAKAHPDKLSYGTSGVGGMPHLATLLMEKYTGVKMTHVPYKGVAPALTDLLGGQIDFALLTPITIAQFIGSDKIRILGITAPTRHPMLPDAPTFAEAGLPQATATVWYGLFGPAQLPAAVQERLRKEIATISEMPAVRDKLAAAGLQMSPQLGSAFRNACVNEFQQWKALAKSENLVVQD
jgi:tripartite-type tricarboxylate transporter receptor subunit TctC